MLENILIFRGFPGGKNIPAPTALSITKYYPGGITYFLVAIK
jgi:hypothetical protein